MKQSLHILIIDDDADDAGFLKGAFMKSLPDTIFTHVYNGQAALDLLMNIESPGQCPDLIFLDLHMPAKNGYQVLVEMKATAQCRDFPVMIISTSILPSEAEKCRRAGCTAYFTKPASLEGYDVIVAEAVDFMYRS